MIVQMLHISKLIALNRLKCLKICQEIERAHKINRLRRVCKYLNLIQ